MKSTVLKSFGFHIILSLVLLFVLSWLSMYFLKSYTHHGQTTEVPMLIGLKTSEIESLLDQQGLLYEISDSVFDNSFPKGTIVEQNPSAKSLVKHNRKIYLTVNALATRLIAMPELLDVSIAQAEATLNSYGLKVGQLTHEPAECDDCVIRAIYRGKSISHKTKVPYGAKIDLVLGQTSSGSMISAPDILNLTLEEADVQLQNLMLSKVAISYVNCLTQADSAKAIIQYQNPIAGEQIKQGSTISVWLSCQ